MSSAILLISCPDKRGITAAITHFVFAHNGNILHAEQHIDEQTNTFFMRIEWSMDQFKLSEEDIRVTFKKIAEQFGMRWQLYIGDDKPRMAIFVSRHLHCLYDLLYRYRLGQLPCTIPLIISNHDDASSIAKDFDIEFHQFPVTAQSKKDTEAKELMILQEHQIDLIVLARYHQILSAHFVSQYENQIINIHHSFLPAFAGKDPYKQAYLKGVKIIGATSHYVIEKLDEGPIIEQDTARVSHHDTLEDVKRKGEDLEKAVLSRALRWHLERKILCYDNKTVVFH
jgi:formyltetrahydrofolate deformylase